MADARHLQLLKKGKYFWNTWKNNSPGIQPDLSGADLSGIDLSGIDLSGADLSKANLNNADLSNTLLIGTVLTRANLNSAKLIKADFSGYRFIRSWYYKVNPGVQRYGKRAYRKTELNIYLRTRKREKAAYLKAKDSRVTLSGIGHSRKTILRAKPRRSDPIGASRRRKAILRAKLRGAVLTDAKFRSAVLTDAKLRGAKLRGADLRRANLTDTNLEGADLSGSNLAGSNLNGANLSRTNLSGTNLSGAYFSGTVVGGVDLRSAKGIKAVIHNGPSYITTDTFSRSEGDIPEVFLKGAGVSDTFITYARSLVQNPIEYYTCFISYSTKDQEFAKRLYADLQARGVRCWFAPEDMKTGDKIRQRIDESIHLYDKLLLVLSRHSIRSSWIEFEVEAALAKENTRKALVLFPVRLDVSVLHSKKSWAAHIQRTRHITDFTNWKQHDDYQKALDRLLRDLKSDASLKMVKR